MNKQNKLLLSRIFLYTFLLLALIFVPTNNLYFPDKKVIEADYKHADVYFKTIDNKTLNAWYVAPKKNYPTIVFSHGNGGNISMYFPMLEELAQKGFGVFVYDYRGYGKSQGFPYENGLYKDLRASVDYLHKEKGIKNKDIILWGISLGGGVSSKIASENDFKALILYSTFTNIKDMGKEVVKSRLFGGRTNVFVENLIGAIPFLQKYDTASRLNKINCPILIVHSKQDELIPYTLAIKNHSINKKTKLFVSEEGGHYDYYWAQESINSFLNSINN